MKDYYQLLNLSEDASPNQVKNAFLGISRRYQNKGLSKKQQAEFQELVLAYKTLIDPVSRASYDQKIFSKDTNYIAKWRDFYKGYTKEQIAEDLDLVKSIDSEVINGKSSNIPTSFVILFALGGFIILGAMVVLAFDSSIFNSLEGVYKKITKQDKVNTNEINFPVKINTPQSSVLTSRPSIQQPVETLRIPKENDEQIDNEINAVRSEIFRLSKSIHYKKAEVFCLSTEQVLTKKEVLDKYKKQFECLTVEIKKLQDYRDSKGHNIPN